MHHVFWRYSSERGPWWRHYKRLLQQRGQYQYKGLVIPHSYCAWAKEKILTVCGFGCVIGMLYWILHPELSSRPNYRKWCTRVSPCQTILTVAKKFSIGWLQRTASPIAEDNQVVLLLASFGDKDKSSYGYIVASLQSLQEPLSWETATARLLQEYKEKLNRFGSSSVSKARDHGQVLAVVGTQTYSKRKYGGWKIVVFPRNSSGTDAIKLGILLRPAH